jgi:putative DNA methylase
MRDRAEQRIGHLYPNAKLPQNGGNADATVIAWLWARTVKCPNPACGARMPLVRSFVLGTKPGKKAWIQPVADPSAKTVRFEVQSGNGSVPEGTVSRRGARCLVCDSTTPLDYVRAEGRGHRMNAQMMAIAADGVRGRNYVPASPEHEKVAAAAVPQHAPDTELPEKALGFRVQAYGFTKHRDLFTPRQLVASCAHYDQRPRDGGM